MKERQILFSAPMVLALLSGSKTQTRRLIKPQPLRTDKPDADGYSLQDFSDDEARLFDHKHVMCPHGKPGDRLWVRETCRAHELTDVEAFTDAYGLNLDEVPYGLDGVIYSADGVFRPIENTREASDAWGRLSIYRGKHCAPVPGIHMPRWASRLTLEVTDVRVERLNTISEADALAEGMIRLPASGRFVYREGAQYGGLATWTAREAYALLWETINGQDSWDLNPWVWVIEFDRVAV